MDTVSALPPVESCRNYLLLLARLQVGAKLSAKLDPSDIVQETLLKAHAKRDQFNGSTEGQRAAWLRTILARTLAEAVRRLNGAEHELQLQQALEESSNRLEQWLADPGPNPVHQAHRNEQLMRMADALAGLPDEQRTALECKHLQGMSLAEICDSMGRTPASVAGLLRRGLDRLRTLLLD